jgi:carboxyl-terminal processing protease
MKSRKIALFLAGLLVLSALLSACQAYSGYPTVVVQATPAPTTVSNATATPRPTLAPPPTFTPRPSLPATPSGVQVQKADVLKEGYDALLRNYFRPLDSGSLYEVGLISIRTTLESIGVSSPQVPIPAFGADANDNWNKFLAAYTIVLDKYKGQVSEDAMLGIALAGTAASLDDCNTGFYSTTEVENFLRTRAGQQSLVGIGINLQTGRDGNNNVHVVSRVVQNGPAEKAGLKLGDQLVKIDGQDTANRSPNDVVQLLLGQVRGDASVGTRLKITVRREGREQEIEVARARVTLPYMERSILPGNVGYLKFSQFPIFTQQQLPTAVRQLQTWLGEFQTANVSGIVIDLRGNNAGSISTIQNFLSFFVQGSELAYLSGAQPAQNNNRVFGIIPMPANSQIQATDKPISVIVDAGTSGEAEIFAHVIQRNKRGAIVGVPTAGCVNASSPVVLKDNSAMNVTTYRAVGDENAAESILAGVAPDQTEQINIQQLIQGKDSQIEAAIKALTK